MTSNARSVDVDTVIEGGGGKKRGIERERESECLHLGVTLRGTGLQSEDKRCLHLVYTSPPCRQRQGFSARTHFMSTGRHFVIMRQLGMRAEQVGRFLLKKSLHFILKSDKLVGRKLLPLLQ